MNTMICFENEEQSCLYNTLVLKGLRKCDPEALLIVISAGDFSSYGTKLEPPCRTRSAEYEKAGADLVLSLPVASVLGGYGKKEFAAAALAQRLRASDLLVIPCVPSPGQTLEDCEKSLRTFAMLMFREESGYRRNLTANLKQQMSLRDAQYQAVRECIPESEELLSRQENRFALWMLDAFLQLYYMPKVKFIAAPAQDAVLSDFQQNTDMQFEKRLARRVAELAADGKEDRLIDIAGSTTQMVSLLLENKEQLQTCDSMGQILSLMQQESEDRTRLFLLKAVLGIRKIYMQICGLHTFVPYCHVSAESQKKAEDLKRLEEGSWVPFIRRDPPMKSNLQEYTYLLQADQKAAELIFQE